jgi:phosphohistidine phosphatase SixA
MLGAEAQAQTPTTGADVAAHALSLIHELQGGGYILVMRHARSPDRAPSASEADAENPQHERQLDAQGRGDAKAVGQALRALHIPIGTVYSSPLYRARETVRLAGLPSPQVVAALAEGPRGMAGSARRSQNEWLQQAVGEAPMTGTDTLIVTHTPNITGAFGREAAGIQAGEMLVFQPRRGHGNFLGRISVGDWQSAAELAARGAQAPHGVPVPPRSPSPSGRPAQGGAH